MPPVQRDRHPTGEDRAQRCHNPRGEGDGTASALAEEPWTICESAAKKWAWRAQRGLEPWLVAKKTHEAWDPKDGVMKRETSTFSANNLSEFR